MAKKKKPAAKKKSTAKAIVKRATTKRRTAVVARKSKPQIATAPAYMKIHREVPLPQRPEIPHEQIARRAYELWDERIRAANDATRNWLDAQRELEGLLG